MTTTTVQKSRTRWIISHYTIVVIALCLIFPVLAQLRNLHLFSPDSSDGFFNQVQYIAFQFTTGNLDVIKEPILGVHILRFIIIYPWFFAWLQGWPSLIEAVLFIPLFLTITTARFKGHQPLIQLIIFLLPFGLSYRTTLTIIGIANLYLYLYSDTRQPWRFYLSALCSFLSSGVALAWFFILVLNWSKVRSLKWSVYVPAGFVFVGLAAVTINKLSFFGGAPVDYANDTGLLGAIQRNTIFVSYEVGDTARFVLYIGILALVAWFISALSSLGPQAKPLLLFFICAASSFLFEGLGAIAFMLPVLWVLSGNAVLQNPKNSPEPSL
ncbi:MAG: hypothetical protein ACKVQS_05700 [Fimbriimonadaceae bacterium]